MRARLADVIADTPQGEEAGAILRSCVHCGFCNAACPTYQVLGDELDGPRGRIYLIKQMLEGETVSERTRLHLDRCLTCRACETACPSGVRYGRLLDIGRAAAERKVKRPRGDRIKRGLLRWVLPYPVRCAAMFRAARWLRLVLPASLRHHLPAVRPAMTWPQPRHARHMLVLSGCVQAILAPNINAAAAVVLDRLGISLIPVPNAGCCGALSYHLSAHDEALEFMRQNIDAWWPSVLAGAEAIVSTASGCGAMIGDYGSILRSDPVYAEKAHRVSELAKDISEVVAPSELFSVARPAGGRLAFHSPCTLQHGQRIIGVVEALLARLGYTLTPVADPHLCCGSAGTYALLQPALSVRLRDDKIAALQAGDPEVIATANIGCLVHLQSGATRPVRHWIELIAELVARSD